MPTEPMRAGGLSEPIHDLTVERVAVGKLHTYHRNPRRGDTELIGQSLVVNGQYRPIVVNRGTHTGRPCEVLAGNHTLMAARDQAWPQVSVCWVDVDDDQAARIVAADNRTADAADYDNDVLVELLSGLEGLDGSGYSDGDLARLVDGLVGDRQPPDEFSSYDDDVDTDFQCPKCSYEWSGKPK